MKKQEMKNKKSDSKNIYTWQIIKHFVGTSHNIMFTTFLLEINNDFNFVI